MARVEKISVALTAELAATMREAVDAGEYASASEVIREAMRAWQQRRHERAEAMSRLGRIWDEGVASGPATDGEAAFERIRRRLDGKLAGNAA